MIRIKVPATCANIGPGYDTMGIALNIYNEFKVEKSKKLDFGNVPKEFASKKNLFYIAYKKTCKVLKKDSNFTLNIVDNIPISRGLGSSASLIVAGALAANKLNGNKLSKDEIFQICCEIEGHPDNVSAALYGGLCVCISDNKKYICGKFNIGRKLNFTVIIPDYRLSTTASRKVLPKKYDRADSVFNISRSIYMVEGLKNENMDLIKLGAHDKIHQPYRKKLIKNFDKLKNICEKHGAAFVLSGAGPTCIAISNKKNLAQQICRDIIKIKPNCNYLIMDCKIDNKGAK